MAFPMDNDVLINVWRETCAAAEVIYAQESSVQPRQGSYNSFYQLAIIAESINPDMDLPNLSAAGQHLVPISTAGIAFSAVERSTSKGFGIIMPKTEADMESLDSSMSQSLNSSLTDSISEEEEEDNADDKERKEEEEEEEPKSKSVAIAKSDAEKAINGNDDIDLTPTIGNNQILSVDKPLYIRKDSARTINSIITDEEDDDKEFRHDVNQNDKTTHVKRPSLVRAVSDSIASIKGSGLKQPDQSPSISNHTNTSSNKSPKIKQQGKQIQTGLRTFGRFILPKLGHQASSSMDQSINIDSLNNTANVDPELPTSIDDSSLAQSGLNSMESSDSNLNKSQRLMSKRRPPPQFGMQSDSKLLDSGISFNSFASSKQTENSDNKLGDNNKIPSSLLLPDNASYATNDLDSDSVVDSIESSDIVDSNYDYSIDPDNMPHTYYDDNDGIVDDLNSDDYSSSDDLYQTSFDGSTDILMRRKKTTLLPNTLPKSVKGPNISQINFKRLSRPSDDESFDIEEDRLNSNEYKPLFTESPLHSNLDMTLKPPTLEGTEEIKPSVMEKFTFEKVSVKKTTSELNNTRLSHLSELLHKTELSLNYYSYVGKVNKQSDELITVHVSLNDLNLELKVNNASQIVELIGYSLFQYEKINGDNFDKVFKDTNYWKVFMVDSDGELEDDFGSLNRTRVLSSYGGADDFAIVKCRDDEFKKNCEITPSPLSEKAGKENELLTNTAANVDWVSENGEDEDTNPVDKDAILEAAGTLPSNLTPISGIKIDKPVNRPANVIQVQSKPPSIIEEEDSEEEEDAVSDKRKDHQTDVDRANVSRSYAYLRGKLSSQKLDSFNEKKDRDSTLSKFKSGSKTIQNMFHNTADHYQLTQQQLMNGTIRNEDDNNNVLSMYHRWTIWRRQQMSFKNKQPKTLTVDGYQIYILPMNDLDGSWYESKTYSFNISQVLKVKQSVKVPSHFKIVVNKNKDGIVKKYYLEAKNEHECSDIVQTIKNLAKSSRLMR